MSEIFGAVSGIFVLSVLKIGNPIVSGNGERSVVFAGQTLFLLNMGALLTSITTYLPMFVQTPPPILRTPSVRMCGYAPM